jgi:hypothetical protein
MVRKKRTKTTSQSPSRFPPVVDLAAENRKSPSHQFGVLLKKLILPARKLPRAACQKKSIIIPFYQ